MYIYILEIICMSCFNMKVIFLGESIEQRPHKRSSVKMGVKLYQISSLMSPVPPHAASSKQFLLTEGHVSLEATLDKEVYEREEPITVNISVTNNSSKSVKKIKVSRNVSRIKVIRIMPRN